MSGIGIAVTGVVIAAAAFFVNLVFEREYWWIARRVGGLLIRLSGLLLPRTERKARVAEWLGELDEAATAEVAAVAFAAGTFVAATAARGILLRESLRRAAYRLKRRARADSRTIGPIELKVWANNYDKVLQQALSEGWTVSRTSGSRHIVLTLRGAEAEPHIVLLDRRSDDPPD